MEKQFRRFKTYLLNSFYCKILLFALLLNFLPQSAICQNNNHTRFLIGKKEFSIFIPRAIRYVLILRSDSTYKEISEGMGLIAYYSSGRYSVKSDSLVLDSYFQHDRNGFYDIEEETNSSIAGIALNIKLENQVTVNGVFLKLRIDTSYLKLVLKNDTTIFIDSKSVDSLRIVSFKADEYNVLSMKPYRLKNNKSNQLTLNLYNPIIGYQYYCYSNFRDKVVKRKHRIKTELLREVSKRWLIRRLKMLHRLDDSSSESFLEFIELE